MADNKKDAAALPGKPAPIDLSAIIIPQANNNRQVSKYNKQGHVLSIGQKVYSVAIKCYDEQLIYGASYLYDAIHNTLKSDFQVLAIKHDRDEYADGIWRTAKEKPHYHIIVRCTDRKKRVRVGTVMRGLGIQFRPNVDDVLWVNHGVETIGNYAGYANYLTHETEEAIRDGKELYDISEIVSNLSTEEIIQVREGYIRVSEKRKISMDELISLDSEAYQLGYNLKNFDAWYGNLSFSIRSNAKMKTVQESYYRGVRVRVEEQPAVLRLCVFIQGAPNSGKTYAARAGLEGQRILTIEGGGTGKFDKLSADHGAILVSDDVCPNLLNMTDNYICQAYRRQRDNPAWTGQYFIVTSNVTFDEWLAECGIKRPEHIQAMRSRFFICELSQDKKTQNASLSLVRASERGSIEEQKQRLEMFGEFRKRFNATIAQYHPSSESIDYQRYCDDTNCNVPYDEMESTTLANFGEWFIMHRGVGWQKYCNAQGIAVNDKSALTAFVEDLPLDLIRDAANQYRYQRIIGNCADAAIIDSIRAACSRCMAC